MKALIISSLLLLSLKAMSEEAVVGENKKSPCPYADQGAREPKKIDEIKDNSKKQEPAKKEAEVVKA